jgi:DNA topoisomerase-3
MKPHAKADRLFDREAAMAIVAAVDGKEGKAKETRKPSQEAPRPLFDLTSLQREANSRFGWSAARTLRAAQACYETHKVLTYPRTSSKCLPSDYVEHVQNAFKELTRRPEYREAATFLLNNGRRNDHKIFDDANVSDHFAIIPTGELASLSGDDERVFDLVVRRFLAAFHPNAVWEAVERITVVEGHSFLARARTLREPGWRAVMGQRADEGEGEERGLPPLVPGETSPENVPVVAQESHIDEDQTKPPPRITEARLLSLMENAGKQVDDEELAAHLSDKGLGTPATRADTIETLKSREYVDRGLRPTAKGIRLIDLLQRIHAVRLTSPELTGELEKHLNEVEGGKRSPSAFMGEINEYATQIVEATRDFDYDKIYPNASPCGTCPCPLKKPVYERLWFYRCLEDPATQKTDEDCPFRIWKDKNGRYIDDVTASTLLRDGRTGELDGFSDRQGRTYKGVLVLHDKEVILEPTGGAHADPGGDSPTFEVNAEPLADCPMHPGGECKVIETPTHFVCTTYLKQVEEKVKKPEGIFLPRLVCKREMKREEAVEYTLNGKTPLIEDFVSRFGRNFKAFLKRGPNGRYVFEFLPREGGQGRGRWGKKKAAAKDGDEATESVSTNGEATPKKAAKKASAKKAPAKKAAKKTTKAVKRPAKKKTAPLEAGNE